MELYLGMDEELTESEWVRIKGRQGTLKRGSATDGLTRKTENMRPFTDREKQPCTHKPCSSWGTSNTLISVNTAAHKQSRSLLECIDGNH